MTLNSDSPLTCDRLLPLHLLYLVLLGSWSTNWAIALSLSPLSWYNIWFRPSVKGILPCSSSTQAPRQVCSYTQVSHWSLSCQHLGSWGGRTIPSSMPVRAPQWTTNTPIKESLGQPLCSRVGKAFCCAMGLVFCLLNLDSWVEIHIKLDKFCW